MKKEIFDKIESSKRFLISLHSGPDGDSFGSCLAMKYFLENQGKEVVLVSYDEMDEVFMGLKEAEEIEFGKDILDFDLNEFDVLVALDSGNAERVGKKKENVDFLKDIFVINIDHHDTNEKYGDLNLVEMLPSTCSVLIEFFKDKGVEFDRELCKRLGIGLATDSGFLTFEKGLKEGLEELNFLIENGLDYFGDVLKKIYFNEPLKMYKYQGILSENYQIENNFGWTKIGKEDVEKLGLNNAEIRKGINWIANVSGIDFAFVLSETENFVKGSFRSKGFDVSKMAIELGGGGHKNASAFILDGMSLEEAEKKVLEVVRQHLNNLKKDK